MFQSKLGRDNINRDVQNGPLKFGNHILLPIFLAYPVAHEMIEILSIVFI